MRALLPLLRAPAWPPRVFSSPPPRTSSPVGAELQRDMAAPAAALPPLPRDVPGLGLPGAAGEEPGRPEAAKRSAPAAEAGLDTSSAAIWASVVAPTAAWEVLSGSLLPPASSSTGLKPSWSSEYLTSPKFLSDERNLFVTARLNVVVVSRGSHAGTDWTV